MGVGACSPRTSRTINREGGSVKKKGAKGARGCRKKSAQLHIRKAEELANGGRCGDAAAACLAREKGGYMSRTTDVVDRRQYGDGPDRVPPCS